MNNKYQDDLQHIHAMMERSSRFLSLSGLSGIFAGGIGLLAAATAFYWLSSEGLAYEAIGQADLSPGLVTRLILTAVTALAAALFFGMLFTIRKSRKNNLPLWSRLSRQLLTHLALPLGAGGLFCIALIFHERWLLVAPVTLVFYGLALISAGKYTFNDIVYLGVCELVLGLVAIFFPAYGLWLWSAGFGVLHIIYGVLMHRKYQ